MARKRMFFSSAKAIRELGYSSRPALAAFEDALTARGGVTVVRDARYVVDGNLVTSQGVSAGIDMALWLVGRIHGRNHARAVRRYIQYEPAPPYLADEPPAYLADEPPAGG